jgi:DNA transposition AAA+ family ATPase
VAADLEQLRDHYDRSPMGVILIGMPGIEKRLARYPQLYSRIGFVHEYRPLSAGELAFVLQRHWAALGLTLSADDFTDTEAIAAVHRITSGNFRLVQRLFAQITRVLEINGLTVISREVVETARESLVEPGRVSWNQEAAVTWWAGFVGTSLLAPTSHGTCHRAMSCQPCCY